MTKLFTAVAVAVAVLTGGAAGAQVILSAETASPGGSAYLAPAHLTEVAGRLGIANIQLVDGQVATNSVLNVAEGKTDLAMSPLILPFLMNAGAGPYAALGKEKGSELASKVRLLYPYSLGVFFLYAYETKGIDGWDDIAGRKVMNGPPSGAALNNARSVIQLVTGMKDGEGYTGIQADWGQVAAVVSDGTADAAILPELFPSGRVIEFAAAGRLRAFSIPKDKFEGEAMQKYFAAPGNAPWTMSVDAAKKGLGENWTVVSEDDTFRGMTTVGGTVVNVAMDEELAYKLTKAQLNTLDELKSKAPFANNVGFDDPSMATCGPSPVQFHKGAVRAWEEKGFSIPDCLKD